MNTDRGMTDGMQSQRRAVSIQSAANANATDLAVILAAVVRRDETALGRLYDLTVGKLFSLTRAILGNSADAEEVVCDVYVQVWQTAATYDAERGSVLAWLLVICRSRALDLLRQRRVQTEATGQALTLSEEAPERGPENLLAQIQEGTAVHRALSQLSPLRRQLVGLAFFRGLSHQEIAATVNLPIGTVKSHLRRSLQSLRGVLELKAP